MINVTQGFKDEALVNDNRSYQYDIRITFQDSSHIDIDNSDLSQNGGVIIDEAVSSDDKLSVGSCIVNKLTLTLKNYNGEFDAYDFRKANVVLKIGLLVEESLEQFQRGIYIVAEPPTYNASVVTLVCYDYMTLLDVPFSSINAVFPIGLSSLIDAMCTACNVQRVTQTLPADSMVIAADPSNDTTTCREMLSYIAQINCMNCRFNNLGKLEFTWFSNGFSSSSVTIRELEDGSIREIADNVVRVTYFSNSGDVNWLSQVNIPGIYNLDVARNDTVVTGIRVVLVTANSSDAAVVDTYETGTDDYIISVENNPLVTSANASTILAILAAQLLGFRYRKASLSHVGMPWMVAGDSALITDSKGANRNIIISSTVFTALDKQTTISAGADPVVATGATYSPETVQYVKQMDSMKPVIQNINQRIANANGLYETDITSQGATITYLHNKQNLSESDIQIQVSDVGVLVTANGTDPTPTWYGLTVDGTLIADILQTNGINADWINTGALVIYDNNNNEIFRADKTGKIFRWDMARSSLGSYGQLELSDDGSESNASLTVSSNAGLADASQLTSSGFRFDRLGTHMVIGKDITTSTDAWYWVQNTHDVIDLAYSTSSSGLTINNKTLETWIQEVSGVAYKTGTITIPSGLNSTATQTISITDILPSGKNAYSVNVTLSSSQLPYINSSGNVVTWISNLSNSAVTISNKTSEWTSYTYYLTLFYH